MSDKAITFGASEGFGAFAGWEAQDTNDATNKARAVALDDMGNEVASKLHDEKQEVTSNYVCNLDANVIPTAVGALVNGLILTAIKISTSPDAFAKMALTGHNHASNAHAAAPALRTGTHGIVVAKAFGVTDFLGDSAGTNDSPISGSVDITCEHADQNDSVGDHLVGENHGGKIEAKTSYAGDHTVVATGFDVTVTSEADENTGFLKKDVSGVKALALA